MGFNEYIKERSEYFYQEEEKEDSVDEPEDFEFKQPEYSDEIEVDDIVDLSDKLRSADDYLYSNSETMEYYANGSGFELTDNSQLYEIIKLVHELTDKHYYLRDLTWKANIKHRFIEFIFKIGDGVEEEDDFFLDGMQAYLTSEIIKNFGSIYNVSNEKFVDSKGFNSLKVIVKKKSEEKYAN